MGPSEPEWRPRERAGTGRQRKGHGSSGAPWPPATLPTAWLLASALAFSLPGQARGLHPWRGSPGQMCPPEKGPGPTCSHQVVLCWKEQFWGWGCGPWPRPDLHAPSDRLSRSPALLSK